MTLKQLHEQVGRLPMRVKQGDSLLVTIEHQLSNGDYCGVFSYANKLHARIHHPDDDNDWQLVPEKKKALAYVDQSGSVYFVLEGSNQHKYILEHKTCERQECFDIESK